MTTRVRISLNPGIKYFVQGKREILFYRKLHRESANKIACCLIVYFSWYFRTIFFLLFSHKGELYCIIDFHIFLRRPIKWLSNRFKTMRLSLIVAGFTFTAFSLRNFRSKCLVF